MDLFKRIFGEADGAESTVRKGIDVRVAAAALLLEMATIDNEFSDSERDSIEEIIEKEYGLSGEEAAELTRTAQSQVDGSVDMWHFTNTINEHYTEAQKLRVIEALWSVVYADGKLDAHEDYLIHRLGKLLRLTHKQLIEAKLRVKRGASE